MGLISVAVPVPFLDLLTYSVPDQMRMPAVGARVHVPIGSRIVTGCVVAHVPPDGPPEGGPHETTEGGPPEGGPHEEGARELKDVIAVLDDEAFVPPAVVALCQWVAEYYVAGVGDALALAMPPGARARASGFKMRRLAQATAAGLETAGEGAPLTEKQRTALEVIRGTTGLPLPELKERGISSAVLKRLTAAGLVVIREEPDERDPFDRAAMRSVDALPGRDLTPEQQAAWDRLAPIVDRGEFHVSLLHGVTGSGKTEIYLRLAKRVVERGRRVLLMVPEIALTPSVAALFKSAFGGRVAIQHSALADGERHDQWHRIRRGDVDVVVGTRSAVFGPIAHLGLVIVDEEHDSSYKQEETPRYHGRDVAIMRASREGALVVLGSATPSMESYQHATSGKYGLNVLAKRVLDRPMAAVRIVNMRDEYAAEGPDVVISRELVAGIEDRLSLREQVVVLLNRRGYATAVICRQCGDSFDCPNCSISLTVHRLRDGWRARCHYCNYSTAVPKQCRKCAAPYLEQTGFGTERVEQHLRDRFPDARIGRVDRDSVRRKGALTSILSRFADGEIDVLVGTQMIAKGHDFPRVTLVGVVSADVGLGMADFRASERTFQLLTQVAGRAGRGERLGEAIVQTLYPEHYSIQLACRQDYPAFFQREIGYRRAMLYPPLFAMINAVVRGRSFDEAMQTAAEIVRRLEAAKVGHFSLLGPAPAPLQRLRGEHRVQFFLKGSRRAEMRAAVARVLAEMPEVRRRVTVDVDPLSVL